MYKVLFFGIQRSAKVVLIFEIQKTFLGIHKTFFGIHKTFFGIQNAFFGIHIFLVDQNPRTSHILQKTKIIQKKKTFFQKKKKKKKKKKKQKIFLIF